MPSPLSLPREELLELFSSSEARMPVKSLEGLSSISPAQQGPGFLPLSPSSLFCVQWSVGEDMVIPLTPHSVPFLSQELLGDASAVAAAAPAAAPAPAGHALAAKGLGCQAMLADQSPTPSGLGDAGLGSRLAAAETRTEHIECRPEPAAGPYVVSEESPGFLLSPQGVHRCVSGTWGR